MASAVSCEGSEAALIIQYVIICSCSMLSPGAGAASVWSAAVFNNKKTEHFVSFWQKASVSVHVVVLSRKSSRLMKGNDAFSALYGDAFIDLLLPR